jgi:uncharacterized membrane protein YphA (DoxX/SURF4 family)
MVTVVMLVALRVTIGWHFLYEGVWKISHADEFSAQPFLTQAKGPAAGLFYGMVPDLDGRQRLPITTDDKDGARAISPEVYQNAWQELKQKVIDAYQLDADQTKKVEELYKAYDDSVKRYLGERDDKNPDGNRDAILGYFEALDRSEKEAAAGNNGAEFQKKRSWDRMQDLRKEVGAWLSDLDKMGEAYRMALWDVLNEDQKAVGMIPEVVLAPNKLPVPLPVVESRTQGLDLAVTYALAAIGLCLVLGFCTRLANLGGAAFLVSVLLTQPPWPTIWPPAPEVVGHALIVDKNFVEMAAMLMLATLPVGRWGGLDFFLYRWLVKPFVSSGDKSSGEKADHQ